MSNLGYKSTDDEMNKLIARLQKILAELDVRIKKLEDKNYDLG